MLLLVTRLDLHLRQPMRQSENTKGVRAYSAENLLLRITGFSAELLIRDQPREIGMSEAEPTFKQVYNREAQMHVQEQKLNKLPLVFGCNVFHCICLLTPTSCGSSE